MMLLPPKKKKVVNLRLRTSAVGRTLPTAIAGVANT